MGFHGMPNFISRERTRLGDYESIEQEFWIRCLRFDAHTAMPARKP
jgi:hypothetical protein